MRFLLFAIFFASGLSALIYESVWSHYLKTILGHAAYAQTVVLIIFMGGMAAGAWLASRYTLRMKRPLTGYAMVEGAVGLAGLVFHGAFIAVDGMLFDSLLPAVDSPTLAVALKWIVAALLILPQSILLGMTFPLMSVGLIRTAPERSGNALALLYFTNSLGAALGVLAAGFLLIPALGLPGAIFTAGLINILLALVAWFVDRRHLPRKPIAPDDTVEAGRGIVLFATAAFITGLASFCYEIGWIRMLSMVLGSTTQAFELMLAAFISGLAFGGFWVRKRLDRTDSLYRFAGRVQLAMGVLALLTIPAYDATYDMMSSLLTALSRNDAGYALFNTASLAISMLIMVPVTFAAGMTLPLFTQAAINAGSGEAGVGRIYASNTVGAIVGVILAVHVLLPIVGTRGAIIFGAVCDIALGAYLLYRAEYRRELKIAVVTTSVFLLVAIVGFQIDPLKTASGVYRHGEATLPAGTDILFHEDGKTTTIDVTRGPDGSIAIRTNGKPDAQVNPPGDIYSADEVTMVLHGALPHLVNPDASTVANIGMGSGISTHVLLADPEVLTVDTIEIEREMIEGARLFKEWNSRAYTDPRSRIYIDDAKSFFSTYGKRYDIIAAEPSNPWISGVASLFSQEFYRRVKNHLSDNGLLVQWLQLYETNIENVASVFKALSAEFEYFDVYHTDNANMIIIARKQRRSSVIHYDEKSQLADDLSAVGVENPADIHSRWLGNERSLMPLFELVDIPANSDFYPILAYSAPRTRFLGENLIEFSRMHLAPVPVLEMLSEFDWAPGDVTEGAWFAVGRHVGGARKLHAVLTGAEELPNLGERQQFAVQLATAAATSCGVDTPSSLLLNSHHVIAVGMNSLLGPEAAMSAWRSISPSHCRGKWPAEVEAWLDLHRAIAARDTTAMQVTSRRIMDLHPPAQTWQRRYIALASLTAAIASDSPGQESLTREWLASDPALFQDDLLLRMLAAMALKNQHTAGSTNATRR